MGMSIPPSARGPRSGGRKQDEQSGREEEATSLSASAVTIE